MPGCDNSGVQTLLVASAGGHLEQLWNLRPRFPNLAGDDVTWVTYDTPQSRSMLRGEQRIFIPPAAPRDGRAAISHTRLALHILALRRWDRVVSTGALPAVPFLSLARARGIDCHFIDSATRVEGPSLSGLMLEKVPGVHRYGQHTWAMRRGWTYRGSVFDSYVTRKVAPRPIERAVVTVGIGGYGFRRLLEAAVAALPADSDVLWQTGSTDVAGLPLLARPYVSDEELRQSMVKADVVVSHAGVGSVLAALSAGRCPIIVPRRQDLGEHVDDHQGQLASELRRRQVVLAVGADELTPEVVAAAARTEVKIGSRQAPFVLDPGANGHAFRLPVHLPPHLWRRRIAA